jgi:S1-C subfamily serine protease
VVSGCNRTAPRAEPASPAASAAPAHAALAETPGVPTRSLLPEIDHAKFGAAAQVHAPAGEGSGLVLPAKHEVLAHLHVVLGADEQISGPIFVDLSLSPEHSRKHLQAYAIAQDPTHDLVLLKVGRPPANDGANLVEGHDKRSWRHRHHPRAAGSAAPDGGRPSTDGAHSSQPPQ